MTEQQVKQIFAILRAEYGTRFTVTDDRSRLWQIILAHSDYQETQLAVAQLLSEARPFPPTIGEINQTILANRKTDRRDWSMLWDQVLAAGARSTYYAEDEARKLPVDALRAIGGVPGLKELSKANNDDLPIIRGQFRQRYEAGQSSDKQSATTQGLKAILPKINVKLIG